MIVTTLMGIILGASMISMLNVEKLQLGTENDRIEPGALQSSSSTNTARGWRSKQGMEKNNSSLDNDDLEQFPKNNSSLGDDLAQFRYVTKDGSKNYKKPRVGVPFNSNNKFKGHQLIKTQSSVDEFKLVMATLPYKDSGEISLYENHKDDKECYDE